MAQKYRTEDIALKDLHPNVGQLDGLPKNPRLIRDPKFRKLVKSIDEIESAAIDIPEIADPVTDEAEAVKDDEYDVEANTPKKATSRLGDVYVLGGHRLICGDSTDPVTLEALMGDKAADLLVTDPPYNVDYQAKGKMKIANDHMADTNFVAFLTDAFANANANMRPGAAHYFVDKRSLTTVIQKEQDIDSMSKQEMRDLLKRIYSDELPKTVIDCPKPAKNPDHPTMKPVPLIGQLIANSSRHNDIVLDIFGGSGTTLIAAEQLQRRCFMVEYEPIYVDVIIKRWEELTGKQAHLVCNIFDGEEITDKQPETDNKA